MAKSAFETLFEEIGTTPNPGWLETLSHELEHERQKLWEGYSYTEEFCQQYLMPVIDMYPTFEWSQTTDTLMTVWGGSALDYTHFTKRLFHPDDPSMPYHGLIIRSPNKVLKPFRFIRTGDQPLGVYSTVLSPPWKDYTYAIPLNSMDKTLTTTIRIYVASEDHKILL